MGDLSNRATNSSSSVSRRQFAAYGAAAAVGGAVGIPAVARATAAPALAERMVAVGDNAASAFFVHPGEGSHPGIVMWADIGGLREATKDIGRRLASAGYAVLVVDPLFRARGPGLTETMINRDAKSFTAFLDRQAAVTPRRAGTAYSLRTVAAIPAVRALDNPAYPGGKSAFLFAMAPGDTARARRDGMALRDAARAAHRLAQFGVYPAAA